MRDSQGSGAGRALALALIVIVVALGGLGWFISAQLDPERLKPRLVAAVRQATGRTMTISGAVGIKLSAVPTIVLDDVTLSNPPGFSRPDMMKVARVELSLAIAPLFDRRVEIGRIVLLRPDIQFETLGGGHGNWVVQREPAAGGEAAGGSGTGPDGGTGREAGSGGTGRGDRYAVSVEDLRVEDGRISWRDQAAGRTMVAVVPSMTLNAPDAAPMTARGIVVLDGRQVAFDLQTGAASQLRTASEAEPWPVRFHLAADGASAVLEGRIARPLEGRGYVFAIDVAVPEAAMLSALFPGVPLAAMKQASAHAEIADGGARAPAIPVLRINIGAVDVSGTGIGTWSVPGPANTAAGARLENVTLTARGDSPLKLSARLAMPGMDAGLSGTVGDLAWLAKGASGPLDIDLEGNVSSARINLKGRIEAPLRRQGYGLDLIVDIPNPALLVDNAPQGLKAIELRTRITDVPGPVAFQVNSSAGDLTGEVDVSLRPRLSISGHVESKRLDVDVLRAPAVSAPAVSAPVVGGVSPGATSPAPGAGTASPGAAPARPAKAETVFSATPLPFDALARLDANLSFQLGVVRLGGVDVAGVTATLAVKDGRARLDPVAIAAPDQHLTGTLEIDASTAPAHLHLTLDAPALAAEPLLAILGLPAAMTGTAEFRADLTATGNSVKELAAGLGGWAGLAIEHGKLDAKMVNSWLDQVRPLRIEGGDATDLRCLAVRMDAKEGIATLKSMAFNTAALIADGGGEVDLRRETLALRLRPRTRIGGTGVAVPLRVTGTLRAPAARVDLSTNGGGALAGLLLGGKDIMGAAGGGDPCPAALAQARDRAAPGETGGAVGPGAVGPGAPEPANTRQPAQIDPAKPAATDVLRLLLGRPEGKK